MPRGRIGAYCQVQPLNVGFVACKHGLQGRILLHTKPRRQLPKHCDARRGQTPQKEEDPGMATNLTETQMGNGA